MSQFLSEKFLLNNQTAEKLYFEYAADQPIIDYHCHVSPKEIWEDKRFENITELWLSGDHYKWRLMRSNGVDEYYITGDADPYEKFVKFAEMLPKSLAKARSEEIALFFASSMQLFVRLMTPVSFIFSGISNLLSRFISSDDSGTVTEEDLMNIIETIEDEGVLSPEKQALVNSAMEFREKLAQDIMIPIELVDVVSSATPLPELACVLRELSYSRVPVYEGNRENIVGILPVNAFLSAYVSGSPIVLRKMLLKPYVFDRNTEISLLLQRMRLNKLHMVFICDENRKKVGLITMEDLLEELVGEIQDESDAGEGLVLG